MRQHKYPKNTFVNTNSLAKWRKAQGLKWEEVALRAEESQVDLERWATRRSVPRAVIDKLGIVCRVRRNASNDKKPVVKVREGSSIPAGGTIYACYVGASEKDAFLAFCSAMHINAKDMI